MFATDLTRLLERYEPTDEREAGFRARMRELLAHASPFARTTFSPGHFTASAFVLSPERDAVALIFHKKLKLWLQPGGHIEPSDGSVAEAAAREVTEEIGISGLTTQGDALFDIDVHGIPARRDEPAHEHFDVRMHFVAATRELSESEETSGAKWVTLDDVAGVTTDESVQRAIRKIRAVRV